MHVHNERNFPQLKLDREIIVPFLLNEHGDLYFLLHDNSVHIIFFKLKKNDKKKFSDRKKRRGGSVLRSLLWNANYDRKNNDWTNVLRPRRFK